MLLGHGVPLWEVVSRVEAVTVSVVNKHACVEGIHFVKIVYNI